MFGVYISFFLMVTLMILVGATWTGLYLAKRITRPDPDAGRRRARHRRGPPRPPPRAGDLGRVRLARRGVQRDGGRAVAQPARPGAVDARPAAAAPGGRGAAPLHRDGARAHHDGRRVARRRRPGDDDQQRGGAAAGPRGGDGRASRSPSCSAGRTSQPLLRAHRRARGPARRTRRRRKSRWRATAANCTWPRPRPACTARAARPRARCSSSTTSRR